MSETTIEAAFKKAGVNTDAGRLRYAAKMSLDESHGNVERAIAKLEKVVRADAPMLRQALSFYYSESRVGLSQIETPRPNAGADVQDGGGQSAETALSPSDKSPSKRTTGSGDECPSPP